MTAKKAVVLLVALAVVGTWLVSGSLGEQDRRDPGRPDRPARQPPASDLDALRHQLKEGRQQLERLHHQIEELERQQAERHERLAHAERREQTERGKIDPRQETERREEIEINVGTIDGQEE